MTNHAYLLFVDNTMVGRAVAIIRSLFEPAARLLPHLTIRFPVHERRVTGATPSPTAEYYGSCPNTRVTITGAGTFGCLNRDDRSEQDDDRLVVFLECRSLELDAYEYKPDFPDSVFHLTLYEGTDRGLAQQLVDVLEEFPWELQVDVDAKGCLVQLRTGRTSPDLVKYSISTAYLDKAIKTMQLNEHGSLSIENCRESAVHRFEILRYLCRYLHEHRPQASTPKTTDIDAMRSVGFTEQIPVDAPPKPALEAPTIFDASVYDEDQRHELDQHGRGYLTPPEVAFQSVRAALSAYGPLHGEVRFGSPWFGSGIFYPMLCAAARQSSSVSVMRGVAVVDDEECKRRAMRRWANAGLKTIDLNEYISRSSAVDEDDKWSIVLADLCTGPANGNSACSNGGRLESLFSQRDRLRHDLNVEVSDKNLDRIARILLAHFFQRDDAIAAWIVPTTYLQREYGAALRQYLTMHAQLLRIHRFGRIAYGYVDDAVDQTLLIVRKAKPDDRYMVRVSWGQSVLTPDSHRVLPKDALELGIRNDRDVLLWRGVGSDLYRSSEMLEVPPIFLVDDDPPPPSTGFPSRALDSTAKHIYAPISDSLESRRS